MKKTILSIFLIVVITPTSALAGLDSKKTKYIGGTAASLKEGVEGYSHTKDENDFVFEYKQGKLVIPYKSVTALEYGQKAGRRVAVAILVTPLALFSKKRKHYLTINYTDANGKEQAAIFELGKNVVRVTLASMAVRTGKEIEYQDEEARKSAKGN